MKYLYTLLLLISSSIAFAQENTNIDMADTMRSEGKIYVVVAVIAIVLVGLFIYLISIDKHLRKLEKKAGL